MEDRFGPYQILSGHEGQGCWWCGHILSGRRYRYCSEKCRQAYADMYFWPSASKAAITRTPQCRGCGNTKALVCHHIEPLNGSYRLWSRLNVASNLRVLCHSCHGQVHHPEGNKDMRAKARRIQRDQENLARWRELSVG